MDSNVQETETTFSIFPEPNRSFYSLYVIDSVLLFFFFSGSVHRNPAQKKDIINNFQKSCACDSNLLRRTQGKEPKKKSINIVKTNIFCRVRNKIR